MVAATARDAIPIGFRAEEPGLEEGPTAAGCPASDLQTEG
jgi:hypothetical protein